MPCLNFIGTKNQKFRVPVPYLRNSLDSSPVLSRKMKTQAFEGLASSKAKHLEPPRCDTADPPRQHNN